MTGTTTAEHIETIVQADALSAVSRVRASPAHLVV
jgi:hypothetical protein